MKLWSWVSLILIVAVAHSAHAGPRMLDLRPGDVIEIDYESNGCFHWQSNRLIIENGIVTVDGRMSMPLTGEMIRGLDRYFRTLEEISGGGCTTIDRVDIELRTRNGDVQEWSYVDASCGFSSASSQQYVVRGFEEPRSYSLGYLIRTTMRSGFTSP